MGQSVKNVRSLARHGEGHVVEVRVELALVDEAEGAQLLLSSLQDQLVGIHVEDAHATELDQVFAHGVLEAHLAGESL
eukprot:CAMPEP_0170458390 /NCGR_PEP_ID=MMETSP0123-20130129/5369_1 /TAXON_ID=182087 /ORGANISM="Favella ehrenbergii, Strain Fehren 1" /LENGTH=77 /DNA_ID=CAMNT_0010722509 /DNA_START=91 /DNA_END=324 /DNA_ORIENTATION=-